MVSNLSNYAKHMAKLSAKIFGEVSRPTRVCSLKVVRIFEAKPVDKNPLFYDYYPRHVEITSLMKRTRRLGLYRDDHQDFKDEMKRLRILRGKIPVKKGEGKNALAKK